MQTSAISDSCYHFFRAWDLEFESDMQGDPKIESRYNVRDALVYRAGLADLYNQRRSADSTYLSHQIA